MRHQVYPSTRPGIFGVGIRSIYGPSRGETRASGDLHGHRLAFLTGVSRFGLTLVVTKDDEAEYRWDMAFGRPDDRDSTDSGHCGAACS